MAGCSHILWCSQHVALREGRAGGARPQGRGRPRPLAAQDRTGGGPRVCHACPPPEPRECGLAERLKWQACRGCALAVGPRPRHCLSMQQGGVEVPSHRVCFPVSVHGSPPPVRERSARTFWAGGRGRRAQVVVTGLPLCLCGRWPDSLPASDEACPGRGWKLSGVQPPTPPSSGLHLTPCPVTPFSPWGIGVLTLITVTRKSCVPWDGDWGSSAPQAWARPSGSAAWSFSGLPCCTAVSPLHCEPQEGGARLSWSLLCPAAQNLCLVSVVPLTWSWGVGVGRAQR